MDIRELREKEKVRERERKRWKGRVFLNILLTTTLFCSVYLPGEKLEFVQIFTPLGIWKKISERGSKN